MSPWQRAFAHVINLFTFEKYGQGIAAKKKF